MKNLFPEYYQLSDDKIKEIWDNGIFVFDTNVLLNLYRYSEKSRNDFLEVLTNYKDRLWIPYQVGLEYHSDRIGVVINSDNAYEQLGKKLRLEVDKLVNSIVSTYKRHPYINIDGISERINACTNEIIENLNKKREEAPDYLKNDDILDNLTILFDGKVGADLDELDLNKLYKEGRERYANKIPPGYCDEKEKKDKGDRHLYGDLILWKQTIEKASETKTDIILVTDDLKEDWWEITNGKTIGPRKELLKEFREAVQKDILIYNAERFLKYAQKHMSISIEKETISEIENFRKEDESIQQIISSAIDNSGELTKAHVAYPWSSAESIANINKLLVTDDLCSHNRIYCGDSNTSVLVSGITPDGIIGVSPAVPKASTLVSGIIPDSIIGVSPTVPKASALVSGINIDSIIGSSPTVPNISESLVKGAIDYMSHIKK